MPEDQPGAAGDPGGREWNVPWAEPWAASEPERAELAASFGAAVRKTGSLMQLMKQAAADRIGINATDLNCLNILSFSGQMTAGELARATGLTTASITGVVDRLEEAGYVRRERDPRDRRRVVVRLVLETALRDVASVFLPMMRDWQQMAARYSDDELRLVVGFDDRRGCGRPGAARPAGTAAEQRGEIPAEQTGRRPWSRGEGPGAPWPGWPAPGLTHVSAAKTAPQGRVGRSGSAAGGPRLAERGRRDLAAVTFGAPSWPGSTWPGRA